MCIGEGVEDASVNASVCPVLVLSTRPLSTIGKPQLSSAARGANEPNFYSTLFVSTLHAFSYCLHCVSSCGPAWLLHMSLIILEMCTVQLALTVEAA